MEQRGFTALEILLVFGIVTILVALSIPAYRQYEIRSDLDLVTQQLTQALGRARLLSQSGKGGSPWGVYVPGSILYKGKSYLKRDPAFDERYPMPPTLITSGLSDVSFSLLKGMPSATGTITVTAINGDKRSVVVLIDSHGIVINPSDKITICHCQSNPPHNLAIPDNAWPAHQKHGDYIGPCQVPEKKCTKK